MMFLTPACLIAGRQRWALDFTSAHGFEPILIRYVELSSAQVTAIWRYQIPGFEPIWTIPQGIKEIWSDAAERGLTAEDFEGPRYVRLQRIQQLAAEGRLDLTNLRLRRNAPRI